LSKVNPKVHYDRGKMSDNRYDISKELHIYLGNQTQRVGLFVLLCLTAVSFPIILPYAILNTLLQSSVY